VARSSDAPREAAVLGDVRGDFAILSARFHEDLIDALRTGARARLLEAGVEESRIDEHHVPGSFELPHAARSLAGTGRFAAIVALGAVIKGESAHFEYVCEAATHGLMRVMLDTGVPIGFGILTVYDLDQAWARAGGQVGNIGEDAADAVVRLSSLAASVA
jgi:6,7-dimethyl-8-ribityllumazine synthase